jgi:hypothetical protein
MYQIKMHWAKGSSMPPWAMVWDENGKRPARFQSADAALECLKALSMIITASTFNGGEVVETDISG